MALTKCSKCGEQIDDQNPLCEEPFCPFYLSEKVTPGRTLFVIFWMHQVLFGLPCLFLGLEVVITGRAQGVLNAIALLLVWIGGSLTWGFAVLFKRP
jgi:hypothetical protein